GAAYGLYQIRWHLAALLFATAAVMSFMRMRKVQQMRGSAEARTSGAASDADALKQTLAAAEAALQKERYEEASQLSHRVLSSTRERETGRRALEVFLWARIGAGDALGARALLLATPPGAVDRYVAAAVQEAAGHIPEAQ